SGPSLLQLAWLARALKQVHDGVDDLPERLRLERPGLPHEQAAVRREQAAGPSITHQLQTTRLEVGRLECHSTRVGVWVAGHLAEYPVTTTHTGKHHRRSELCAGKIGERKRDQDY